jgi:hypothetical protein
MEENLGDDANASPLSSMQRTCGSPTDPIAGFSLHRYPTTPTYLGT